MSKTSKFLAGAILGAAAAALLTPVSGKKARRILKTSADKAGLKTDKYDEKIRDLVEQGSALLKNLTAPAARQGKAGAKKSRQKK